MHGRRPCCFRKLTWKSQETPFGWRTSITTALYPVSGPHVSRPRRRHWKCAATSDQNVNIVVSAHILGADGYRDAHVLRQHTSADMTIKHNADEALFEVISNDEKQQSYTQAFHRVRSELSHHQLLNQSEGHHRSYFRSVRRRVDNHVRKFRLMNLRYYWQKYQFYRSYTPCGSKSRPLYEPSCSNWLFCHTQLLSFGSL